MYVWWCNYYKGLYGRFVEVHEYIIIYVCEIEDEVTTIKIYEMVSLDGRHTYQQIM